MGRGQLDILGGPQFGEALSTRRAQRRPARQNAREASIKQSQDDKDRNAQALQETRQRLEEELDGAYHDVADTSLVVFSLEQKLKSKMVPPWTKKLLQRRLEVELASLASDERKEGELMAQLEALG